MKIIIVGGGKVGYYVASNMIERDYKVILIEKDQMKCIKIANELDIEVICGDGTEIELLANSGVSHADCFIAVTGSDQDNLVATQLAKKKFFAKKVITRANNPRNLEALRKLGVDNAVSSTEIITRLIEQEIEFASIKLVATLNKGKAAVCTTIIPKGSKIEGIALKNLKLPESSLIVSLLRNEKLIIPQGDTVIQVGDEVVAVCDEHSQKKLTKILSN